MPFTEKLKVGYRSYFSEQADVERDWRVMTSYVSRTFPKLWPIQQFDLEFRKFQKKKQQHKTLENVEESKSR